MGGREASLFCSNSSNKLSSTRSASLHNSTTTTTTTPSGAATATIYVTTATTNVITTAAATAATTTAKLTDRSTEPRSNTGKNGVRFLCGRRKSVITNETDDGDEAAM